MLSFLVTDNVLFFYQAKGVHPASESSILHGDVRSQPTTEADIRMLTAKSAPSTPSRLPDTWLFLKLWDVYVRNVDPLLKVLHIPTSKPRIEAALSSPEMADESVAFLLYAVCYAATTTLDSIDVFRLLEAEKGPLLEKLGKGIEQYLTRFSMITNPSIEYIQALIIHIVTSPFTHSLLLMMESRLFYESPTPAALYGF